MSDDAPKPHKRYMLKVGNLPLHGTTEKYQGDDLAYAKLCAASITLGFLKAETVCKLILEEKSESGKLIRSEVGTYKLGDLVTK